MAKSLPAAKKRMLAKKKLPSGASKPSLRRLAYRGGVKKMAAGVYDEARAALGDMLGDVEKDAALLVEHAGKKTVRTKDVVEALKHNDQVVYGVE